MPSPTNNINVLLNIHVSGFRLFWSAVQLHVHKVHRQKWEYDLVDTALSAIFGLPDLEVGFEFSYPKESVPRVQSTGHRFCAGQFLDKRTRNSSLHYARTFNQRAQGKALLSMSDSALIINAQTV